MTQNRLGVATVTDRFWPAIVTVPTCEFPMRRGSACRFRARWWFGTAGFCNVHFRLVRKYVERPLKFA